MYLGKKNNSVENNIHLKSFNMNIRRQKIYLKVKKKFLMKCKIDFFCKFLWKENEKKTFSFKELSKQNTIFQFSNFFDTLKI